MAEKLTPQQQQAVDDRGGNLLVSAAAGSGKTKVLVDRLMKYILDPIDPANIDQFLLITYTKAAASELRAKIAGKLSELIAQNPSNKHLQRQLQRLYLTKISTVHSFCSDILREYAYKLDISGDFRVADENECTQLRSRAMEQVLEEAYANVAENPDFQAFVDTQGLGRNDTQVPEIIEKVYDSAMCHMDPEQWCNRCIQDVCPDGATDPVDTVWGRFIIDDLFACLDLQIQAMDRCAKEVSAMAGMDKPAALLADTVYQLQHLRSSETWSQIVQRKNISYGTLTFSKKFDDPTVTEPVKAVRKACKELLAKKLKIFADSAEQVMTDLTQSASAARGLIRLVEQFGAAYGRLKRGRRILDFSDLEHRTLDLFRGKKRSGPTAAALEIGDRFREIMVDEYQDSNGVQDAIFSALTAKRQNLFMVGDVKQSIYQFRLADPGIFLDKYSAYVPADEARPGQGRKVLLSSNFRSGGGVIDGVNFVFENCMTEKVGGILYGEGEALKEGIPHIPLPEPEMELHAIQVQEETYAEEAAFVADHIADLLDGTHYIRNGEQLRPVTADDIVILLRSPGSVGMEYQYALESRGIRCASGTGMDLLLTEEVGTLRSILQVISNPRQDIPLIAALASPVFGFSADELATIRGKDLRNCFYEAMGKCDDPKVVHFLTMLAEFRKSAAMESLPELLERIFNSTRLDSVYTAMDGGTTRRTNLQTFYQLAVNFASLGSCDLDHFLEQLDMLEEKGLMAAEQASGGCVRIMSIHKSKGLEFPVVYLCGLARRFNQESLRAPVLCHKTLGLGLSCVDSENRVRYPNLSKNAILKMVENDSLSEEMRVLYVAMTRARDRLIMTYASQSLEKDLTDIALRSDISGQELMTKYVSCPGDWVLYAAMKRMEAGELFAIGGRVKETVSVGTPWRIVVHDSVEVEPEDPPLVEEEMPVERAPVFFTLPGIYEHAEATTMPSKLTATQQKGRLKDQEAAEDTKTPAVVHRSWRAPSFRDNTKQGKTVGSAIHAVLQYLRYDACTDKAAVEQEIQRLVQERYVTEEQGKLADAERIARFFASDMGTKLRTSSQVLREFKFSILDDAQKYAKGLAGEQVLLQGVVDCALVEEDGITIVDFKTDRVTEETVANAAAGYYPQVEIYADALARIYGLPIKAKMLYFFQLDRFWAFE